jgi:endonuclease/exonuclease/phosphatase family metal-dependent hydrolase
MNMNIKVMSFNLRTRVASDGINCFDNRVDRILETIRTESPDLIGFQEATDGMREIISNAISDEYIMLGAGRNADYTGEGVPIAFKRSFASLFSFETFWLSATPSAPGSCFEKVEQSRCPRIAVIAKLVPNGYGKTITFCNTHLDHMSDTARLLGMSTILQKLSECGEGLILTGDMNARPDSLPITAARAFDGGRLLEASEPIDATFHAWGSRAIKIDYIFSDLPSSNAYHVPDEPAEGQPYISDHYPICATLSLF